MFKKVSLLLLSTLTVGFIVQASATTSAVKRRSVAAPQRLHHPKSHAGTPPSTTKIDQKAALPEAFVGHPEASWEIGGDWGQGVLRTLERGAEDNASNLIIFHHVNYPSVWGLHVLHRYDLGGRWRLGWQLGYRDLGKTTGSYLNTGAVPGGLSKRTLKAEGFDGLLRVDYALSRDWGVYGALGGMVWQLHRSVEGDNGAAYPGDASRTQIDPEYALGLRYVLSPLVLTLSYDRVQGSETGAVDQISGGTNTHLDPTSTSVLLGISYGLGSPVKRVRDMRSTISGWELGFSWGEGVLRTLERGAEDNFNIGGVRGTFTHKNHGSVWGVNVLHRYDLEGGLSLGWELGYRDLGKTSGTYDVAGFLSTRLLRGEGFDGLLRLDYALSRDWGVYGALGGMVWQLHRSVEGENGQAYPGDASRTQIDPEYALGLRYVLSPLVLTLSYDRVQGSETGAVDQMANFGDNAHLDPTSSSVLLGISYGLGRPLKRVRDMRSTISGWELGFSWGEGVLRTLERGSEDNIFGPLIFTHKNHGSVWGVGVLHRYDLEGGLSLGWELGYRDLGKTSGTYDRGANGLSTRLLRGEGFDGLLRVDYALSRDWGVYGALGGMVWQLHRSVEGDNGLAYPGDASRTQIDPEYALGLRYRLSPLVLTLSYDRVQGSETAVDDQMGGRGDNAHLDPTSSSVLLGISYGLGSPTKRVRDLRSGLSSWEVGFSWGEGVLRTLERGAEDNEKNGGNIRTFAHKNHGSVWGVGVLHRYDLEGGLSLGWELGYRDLGKTSGTYDRVGRLSTRLLRGEGFDGLLRIDYALSRDWGVYGALGGMVWQLHRSVEGDNGIAYPGDASRTQIDPEYALGLRYVLSPLVLTLSYDRVQGSETGAVDRMAAEQPNAHLDPTSSSVLLGISYGLGSPLKRVRDMRSTISGWELGFSWGEGVLRTLERGAEDNQTNLVIFHHVNYPSVWGLHVLHRYDLGGRWRLGWQLGYRDLGKTTGSYLNTGGVPGGLSKRTLKAEGFDGLLRVDYALSRDWGVYGALGGMVWQLHRSVEGDNFDAYPGDASRTQIDPEYALGLRYRLSPIVLTLSYDRVQGSETAVDDRMGNGGDNAHLDPTSTSVLLGVAVTF